MIFFMIRFDCNCFLRKKRTFRRGKYSFFSRNIPSSAEIFLLQQNNQKNNGSNSSINDPKKFGFRFQIGF